MRRIIYERHGPPADCVRLVCEPDPEPGPGQLRLRLKIMPIHPADLLAIEGRYGAEPAPLPATPGAEAYGIVDAIGADVDGWSLGQPALPLGRGCWRDALIVDARSVLPAPKGAPPEQAAMLKANPATAEAMLTAIRPLSAGDWVIQNAANSAVGRLVVRFAREKGFRTVNIVRRGDVVGALKADGADAVLVDDGGASEDELVAAARAATGGIGAAVAFDAVGGAATNVLARSLAEGGAVAVYGLLSGRPSEVDARELVFRGATVRGFWLADWFRETPFDEMRAVYDRLAERLLSGRFETAVEARYPLERAAEAVAHAARPGRSGKILLTAD